MAPSILATALRTELRAALQGAPCWRAVWLGLRSGVTLAAEGSTDARYRLTRQAPSLLASQSQGPLHLQAGPHGAVAVVPVDEEKFLLALATSPTFTPGCLGALEASAARLAASFDAWAQLFAPPEDSR